MKDYKRCRMKSANEKNKYISEAKKVDFLSEDWEIRSYAHALKEAVEWGKEIDKRNKRTPMMNDLVEKYNN